MTKRIVLLCICRTCGDHGRFIYSTGERSAEFSNTTQAKEEVTRALQLQKIVQLEATILLDLLSQIEASVDESDQELAEALTDPDLICPELAQISDTLANRTLN